MRGSRASIFGILVVLWSVMPVYWVFNLSLQTRLQIYNLPPYIVPPTPTVENYMRALGLTTVSTFDSATGKWLVPQFLSGLTASVAVATLVTMCTLALCIPAGHAFASFSFRFRSAIFFTILFGRSLPPIST